MISFDVFDTLITRTTATPYGVFVLMQRELENSREYLEIPRDLCGNFAVIRENAEKMARSCLQKGGIEDVTLEEIYQYLCLRGNITERQQRLMMKLEMDTEYAVSRGIFENIQKVKELLNEGERVILISDMYLSKEFIKSLLVKADAVFEKVPLYVSNEYKKIKSTTNLFQCVKSKEKVSYAEWKHIGDNEKGDYVAPKKLGIDARRYSYPQFLSIERKLLDEDKYDWRTQLTIGISKNVRIGNTDDVAYAIGSAFGAPILTQYVEWILMQSIEKKIKRLYFIARDGFILKEIADIIIARTGWNLETNYIYGSRKAWRMASVCEKNCDIEELLNWSHLNSLTTYKKIADVFQIEEKELKRFIPNEYANVKRISSVLRKKIIKFLQEEAFREFLIEKHKDKRKKTVDYLKRNINTTDDNFAFVELAGSGYTQICLSSIMQDFYQGEIKTYFYKMDKMQKNINCLFYVFFPSRLIQHVMIEVLCHAPHGQTRGYIEEKNKIKPDIERYEEAALKAHGIENYIKGVREFTIEKYKDDNFNFDIKFNYIEKLYQYLTKTPDPYILNFIGDMPNSVTGRENAVISYAPRLSQKDIFKLFFYRTYEPIEEFYQGTSLEFSLMRCTDRQRKLMEWCKKYHGKLPGNLYRIIKTFKEGGYLEGKELIPWEGLGRRVVIYAAGHFGQICYEGIKKSGKHTVVLWVDRNWKDKRENGLNVEAVEKLLEVSYDSILVALEDTKTAEGIKGELVSMGIEAERIVTL